MTQGVDREFAKASKVPGRMRVLPKRSYSSFEKRKNQKDICKEDDRNPVRVLKGPNQQRNRK